jgi:3-oxoacyl-[acyl-carrier protein] reductase
MSKLQGKVAIVTGASKGIGAAIAKAYAAEGATVVVNYASDKAGAERVVAEITGKGGKSIALQGDVAKAADVERVFSVAKETYGRVDVLVNNAGVYQFQAIDDFSEAEFHRQFNINVLGPLLTAHHASKHFGANGGSIINVSSLVSTKAFPNAAIYSGTKGALDSITRVLAAELGPRNIRVNTIAPGMVESEGAHSAGFIGSDFQKLAVANTPLGRLGQPDDIADIAVFLASDDSRWLTGDRLTAAGGF